MPEGTINEYCQFNPRKRKIRFTYDFVLFSPVAIRCNWITSEGCDIKLLEA